MHSGGIILAVIVSVVAALLFGPLLLKASNDLRGYRPDAFRAAGDGETQDAIALGGGSLAQELRRHRLGPSPDHIESLFHLAAFTQGGQQGAA